MLFLEEKRADFTQDYKIVGVFSKCGFAIFFSKIKEYYKKMMN